MRGIKWVSVDDDLPPENERVLIVGNCVMHILRLISQERMHWIDDFAYTSQYNITHWSHLPEQPKID